MALKVSASIVPSSNYDNHMLRRTSLLLLALATSLCARNRIAYIEFFGYQGIDVEAVRKALPFKEGDGVAKNIKEQAKASVKRVTGGYATDVAQICCTGDSDYAIFIGLPGNLAKSSRLARDLQATSRRRLN